MITDKKLRNQFRGKTNKAIGDIFEQYIKTACVYYLQLEEADIEKTPEPMKIIKSLGEGRFITRFEKKAQTDFKGTLKGGKTIVFEAKHTDGPRINQNRVTEEQGEQLSRYEALGAESGVLVSIQLLRFYFIPWVIWEAMQQIYGHKHMTVEELAPYQVPFKNGIILFLSKR